MGCFVFRYDTSMTATTHQLGALVIALVILTMYPSSPSLVTAIVCVMMVMIGALTPDLDQPAANLWHRMLGGRTLGDIFHAFSGGHRHVTHSVIGIVIIAYAFHRLIATLITPEYHGAAYLVWKAFMIGYISHPILDTFTDRGVPWLWPLPFHLRIPPGSPAVRVTTSSFVELILVRGMFVVIAILIIQTHWNILRDFFL